jgi:hypothetical protein
MAASGKLKVRSIDDFMESRVNETNHVDGRLEEAERNEAFFRHFRTQI